MLLNIIFIFFSFQTDISNLYFYKVIWRNVKIFTHDINRLNVDSFPEQKEMTKDDYVIICGDFGIWDNSKREKYNLSWLDDKPFTTLFVSGNHENYDILDSLKMSEWHGGLVNFVRKSVIHLMRGQVFNIEE